MTQHKIIGIDLAKNILFLVEINHKGKNLNRKNLNEVNYLTMSQCKVHASSRWRLALVHITGLANSKS